MKAKDIIAFIKKHYVLSNFAAMALVLLLVLTSVIYGLDSYTRHGEEIEIPDLRNKPVDIVEKELEQLDLNVCVNDTGYVKQLAAGCILDQVPEAGTMAKAGHTIYVVINSSSSPNITIPDIIDNSSLREAEAKLRALGFRLDPAKIIAGEKDWVYGLEYNGRELMAGEKVPAGRVLRVVVGDGSTNLDENPDSIMTNEEDGVMYDGGETDEFEVIL